MVKSGLENCDIFLIIYFGGFYLCLFTMTDHIRSITHHVSGHRET